MTDVLKIALDRRAELHEEVARIDEFIRMADVLMRKVPSRTDVGEEKSLATMARELAAPRESQDGAREASPSSPVAPGITRMNLMRRGPAIANG